MEKASNIFLAPLFLATFLSGCKEPGGVEDRPGNLIPDSVFTQVLVDFAQAESAANMNIRGVPNQMSDSVYAFDPLAERNLRKTQYDSTLSYYSNNTEAYKKVYEKVLEVLSERQSLFQQVKADSVSK